MKNPPHPGDLIKTGVIEALGLSVSKAAEILKVRRATLSDLLHGKAALTPEMALRIEKAYGPGRDHLLRMQLAYDMAKTRTGPTRRPGFMGETRAGVARAKSRRPWSTGLRQPAPGSREVAAATP
jgi:addiction module HigA family antidote